MFIFQIFMSAHRRERCIAATKAVMKERQADLHRLDQLGRDTTQFHLPGKYIIYCF